MTSAMASARCTLLTGVAGFMASHVANRMVRDRPDRMVIGVDRLSYCSSIRNLAPETLRATNFRFVRADIADPDEMRRIFVRFPIDSVVHLAAQTHVDNSFGNSFAFTRDNVMGTHVLLECARQHHATRFVHISTDEVYGDSAEQSRESAPLEPTNPYAATKVAAEYLVKAYHRSFGLPVVIVRSNNTFGPGQFPEKLVPKFTLRLLRGERCSVHGRGDQRRSWLYIDDFVDALMAVVSGGRVGEVYNIGSQEEHDVMTITRKLLEITNAKLGQSRTLDESIEYVADRCFNDRRYWIDAGKLQSELGWRPRVSLDDGLRRTVDWYAQVSAADHWQQVDVDSIVGLTYASQVSNPLLS